MDQSRQSCIAKKYSTPPLPTVSSLRLLCIKVVSPLNQPFTIDRQVFVIFRVALTSMSAHVKPENASFMQLEISFYGVTHNLVGFLKVFCFDMGSAPELLKSLLFNFYFNGSISVSFLFRILSLK